jgi:toxin-antitoxin system PIN domain toxin
LILLDVNLLVRAHRPEFASSGNTLAWLEQALVGDEPVAVWDAILISSFRVLTHPKLVREIDAPVKAIQFLQEVRDASTVVGGKSHHWKITRQLIESARATGNLVTDASIAAVAIENNCRLATFDQDFARFPTLQWFEPHRP